MRFMHCWPRNSGYFSYNSVSLCVLCLPLCATCWNENACISYKIQTGITSSPISSKCGCLEGYYYKDVTNLCVRCHPLCSSCISDSECTQCKVGVEITELIDTTFRCYAGYYFKDEYTLCQKCHTLCKTCFGGDSSSCLSCTEIYGISTIPIQSACSCLNGYYFDAISYSCVPCKDLCLECIDYFTCKLCQPNANPTYTMANVF